jgi:hypothetical protein
VSRLGHALAALAGAALLGSAPAAAATGVSIDVARIVVSQRLAPGGVYRLPAFGIRNPGSERTVYRLGVTYLQGQTGKRPPAEWFHFTPDTIVLDAGESQAVSARVELPPGADSGDYAALVGAQIVPEQSGARVGAAAAARLTFAVEPSSGLEAWLRRIERLFSDQAPWSWFFPVLVASTLLAWRLGRRYSISVARRS